MSQLKNEFIHVRLDAGTKHRFTRFALQHRSGVSAFLREEIIQSILETNATGLPFLSRSKAKEVSWTALRLRALVDGDENMSPYTRETIRDLLKRIQATFPEVR